MLSEIGAKVRVPDYIKRVKAGEIRLMGFGHRVYKHYDPRAEIIKRVAEEVFTVTGTNPLLEIALELERIALQDDYFVSRHLYPNVDFYSGIIYKAMGLPVEMFPVLFAIPRTSGWLAQWEEQLQDPEQKIVRPRQLYDGPVAPTTCRWGGEKSQRWHDGGASPARLRSVVRSRHNIVVQVRHEAGVAGTNFSATTTLRPEPPGLDPGAVRLRGQVIRREDSGLKEFLRFV